MTPITKRFLIVCSFCLLFFSCTKSNYTASFHAKSPVIYGLNADIKSLPKDSSIVQSTQNKLSFLNEEVGSKIESKPTNSDITATAVKKQETINKPTKNQSKTTKPNDDYPKLPVDGFALTSFIMGVLFPLFYWAAPLTLLFGIISLSRINKRGTRGKGFAITGIVIGSLILLLAIAALLIFLLFFSSIAF